MDRNFPVLNLKKRNGAGFTLVELVVVVGVIALLSALAVVYSRGSQESLALQRSAMAALQDIKKAEELSLRGQSPPSGCAMTGSGYGIFFDSASPNSYLIFADCNANKLYDAGDSVVAPINLESGIVISSVSQNPLSIVFVPPDPLVWINAAQQQGSQFTVVLAEKNNPSAAKSVTINSKGTVSIQ